MPNFKISFGKTVAKRGKFFQNFHLGGHSPPPPCSPVATWLIGNRLNTRVRFYMYKLTEAVLLEG